MNMQPKDSDPGRDWEGYYADTLRIGQNAYKFVFKFGQIIQGTDEARFHTTIITGPDNAREFFKILKQSLEEFEASFGKIKNGT